MVEIYQIIFQATVYLLEKLEVLLGKSSEDEIRSDVLPLVFNTLESNSLQGQVSIATWSNITLPFYMF